MKKLILVLLFIPLVSFGQTKDEMELCMAFQTKSFLSNIEAENALDKILSVTGLKKNFTLTPCDGIKNAVAVSLKGERYILYDKDFMNDIGDSSSNIAILAHEIGHHLNNHARDITMYIEGVIEPDSKEVSRRHELEADEFAGFVMARLGYSLEQAKQPFYRISSNKDDSYSTHPSRDKRLTSVTKGYNDGKVVTKEKIVYVTKEKPVIKEKIVYKTKGKGDNEVNESVNNEIENRENIEETESYLSKISESINNFIVSKGYAFSAVQYKKRGDLKVDKEDYREAIKDYSEAIRLEPNNPEFFVKRGNSKSNLKDFQGAIKDLNISIELEPYKAEYYFTRGLLRTLLSGYKFNNTHKYNDIRKKHQKSNAVKIFDEVEEALKFNNRIVTTPSNRDPSLGIVILETPKGVPRKHLPKEIKDILLDFERATELKTDYVDAYFEIASVFSHFNNYENCISTLSKIIELEPDNSYAYYKRGNQKIYLAQDYYLGMEIKGEDYSDFGHGVGWNSQQVYYFKGGDEDYSKAIETFPKYTSYSWRYGQEEWGTDLEEMEIYLRRGKAKRDYYIPLSFTPTPSFLPDIYKSICADWRKAISLGYNRHSDAYSFGFFMCN